jgi:penicillin amidase
LVAVGALAACADGGPTGPFDALPLDGDFVVDVGAPVHVARDRYGVAHISANTLADAAFVQGYVMAHDRLPQMDILRRFGAGTLAELFGGLDPAVIDSDLEMRMHRMKPLAEQAWATLQASSAAIDKQIVQLLERFADGVNRYARDLRTGDWTIDPAIALGFDPAGFADWSPIDSLVLARFEAFALAFSAPFEIDATELYQKLRTTYDAAAPANPAAFARRGISRDLLRFTPVGTASTIDGFPNVAVDTGSRSDGSGQGDRRAAPDRDAAGQVRSAASARTAPAPRASPARLAATARPQVPQQVFDDARAFFGRQIHDGALGPHAFLQPHAGANSWAVASQLAGGSHVMLAADQHLQLTNPSMFYPTHLIVQDADGDPNTADDGLDVLGVTLPGIPGVILGSNGNLAWSGTASEHDVNDVYLEQIAPCPAAGPGSGGDCVAWTDPQGAEQRVPIETFTEDIRIGVLGAISSTTTATYEVVPHHGPIIPAIDRTAHQLVRRTAASALSVRFTGYQPTFEIRALYNLGRARTVADGFRALRDITYGSQNWTLIDTEQHIGWTTQAEIPVRKPAAYGWDPSTNPDGLAPFFVLPGNGDGDWIADHPLSPRFIPHAIDPAKGYLVTANADPVGATFDGNPLDQGVVSGEPLYVGVGYAAGLREDRITALIQQASAAGQVTLDDMAAIQRDTHSSVGERLAPAIVAALAQLDRRDPGPPDVIPYLDALPAADAARLATARSLMASWSFATPAAIEAPDADSAATALFNTWMHFFIERTLKDELDAAGFDVWRLDDNLLVRIVHAMFHDPGSFVTSPSTGQPILCDNYGTPGPDDSCTKAILQAMVDAMTHLESASGFGTADTRAWRWGLLHRLTIAPLFPDPALDLPGPGEAAPAGFPRAGDNFAINRSDPGWSDLDFSQRAEGPAQRFIADARPGEPIAVTWALPGGAVFDPRSPHYRDVLDGYYLPERQFAAAFSTDQIVAAGESRWVFH